MEFSKITSRIAKAIAAFQRTIPDSQRQTLEEILFQLRKLQLDASGNIKSTVENVRVIGSLRGKLLGIILNDEYVSDVKEYVKAFRDVTSLQNKYWEEVVPKFRPRSILKEIRKQTVEDTVNKLTEAGIGTNIADKIRDILRTNITAGGSYRKLEQQLRDSLMENRTGEGQLQKYTKQITTDALSTYSRTYTKTVSDDIGAEWFQYQGTEIKTSRPFCQAMHEQPYFHISQVPNMLRGKDANGAPLEYSDINTGDIKTVEVYAKTGLPNGFIPGTNAVTFFNVSAGYFCPHVSRPVLREASVPLAVREMVYATSAYQAWKRANATGP